jgi:glutamate racemase
VTEHLVRLGKCSPIGVFDSGVGGITVLKTALRVLPAEDYIYFADSGNVPYGMKPRDDVIKYVSEAVSFLVGEGVKALLVACNTATSVAAAYLRSIYNIPIIGMEPAVKPAVRENGEGRRVLVIATPLTLSEDKFKNLVRTVDGDKVVDFIPVSELVKYAEQGDFSSPRVITYIEEMLSHLDMSRYGALVLGCTHFIFFRESFRRILPPSVKIIDGNEGTVRNLKHILEESSMVNTQGHGSVSYCITGGRAASEKETERFRLFLDYAPDY